MESSRRYGGILLPMMPEQVSVLVERYLQLVDEALPERIEGLYLVGSIALNDFKAGSSDIDFVSVTRDRLSPRELDRLEKLHASLRVEHRRPWFSGIYV
ncbi:MAG: nucleotidyltransferase domain-containing protein, partial [Chloroflexota bacterium]|nr:nucleotidyltransferase domain-containing protein [Chloroflexota bacterium]